MSTNSATTPVVPGFYPDPTVCRVGDDYYLAHSSFEYLPGVPIWHSRNLVSWTQIGHVITRRSQMRRGAGRPSSGLYAGTLRHHDGEFWYVTTNIDDHDAGHLIVRATDPAGPWSDPVHVPGTLGIDPDLAWDGDDCYLTWKGLRFGEGEDGILQARIDPRTGALLTEPYPVWQGSGLGAVEAPHLYRVGATWYLVLAEGGTERGHCATVARAAHPAGPFEGCPGNPVLTHRSTTGPVQNAGHADLVTTPDGGWAAVYLAVRPRGSAPGFHVVGRETFLAGVDWSDAGWPVFDVDRFAVPAVRTDFDDEFGGPALDHRWVVPAGEPETTARLLDGGGVRIAPAGASGPGMLCTRVRDLTWTAEAQVVGDGRFLVRMDHRHWYGLALADGRVTAEAGIGDLVKELGAVPAGQDAILRIQAVPPSVPPVPLGDAGPDEIVLSAVVGDSTYELARLDGRYLSTEVASGFTGRMLALAAGDGPGTIRAFSYRAGVFGDRAGASLEGAEQ